MRKVKIVSESDFDKIYVRSKDFQSAINRSFQEVAEENGSIINTTYLRTNGGDIQTVIIEYDVIGA